MAYSRIAWVSKKKDTALRLAKGECGGTYAEGMIILSAVISAIAAEVWSGSRIDRTRFVELIKDYCDQGLDALRISVPLLVGKLRNDGRVSESERLRKKYLDFGGSRVVTGKDVDQSEHQIAIDCPTLSKKDIRSVSYACVLYEDVRSSYVHEYRSGARSDAWAMSDFAEDKISYVNWVHDPDRHIHFPVAWVAAIAESVATSVDRAGQKLPLAHPSWWLDG